MKIVPLKTSQSVWDEMPEWAYPAMQGLLAALKSRDPYTYAHCLRVGRMSELLASELGLDLRTQGICELAGTFHDIGKIGVPDKILFKPARLDSEEEKVMRAHPLHSVEIVNPLSEIPAIRDAIPGIKHHHERIDGKGYPDRLKGDAIPLIARVVTVVDAFDAITSNRVYRDGKSVDWAMKELERHGGTQFEASLVALFVQRFPNWSEFTGETGSLPEEQIAKTFSKKAA